MRLIISLFLISALSAVADFNQIPLPPGSEQELGGIGAVLSDKLGKPVIHDLLPDSPAAKAGLNTGDIILEVDAKKTDGMELTDVISRIRGPAGTKVHLVVQRAGKAAPLVFDVMRKQLHIPPGWAAPPPILGD